MAGVRVATTMLKDILPNAPMLPLCNPSPQVFSAPCYPQFGESFANLGAVAILGPPAFDSPRFVQYEAAPRPQVGNLGQGGGRSDLMGRLRARLAACLAATMPAHQ